MRPTTGRKLFRLPRRSSAPRRRASRAFLAFSARSCSLVPTGGRRAGVVGWVGEGGVGDAVVVMRILLDVVVYLP